MDLVDRTLGQFQILEQVGKGGMATVYRAYQSNLQRQVAIKVLSPKLADDLDLVKRFLREAQSAAALHHPNVIVIHDVGSEGDIHYIVTEFLEGMTLASLLEQEGALPLERVQRILSQIAGALDYAHSKGYIHRDIKPSNVMVDPAHEDRVTLMDFGLVQVAGGSRITRTGFIMGTPDYMSPEQARGDPIDSRTDIYSLGVTVYHMLTGGVPFQRPTPHAVLLAHIMEDPPSITAAHQEIPQQVEAIVRKAMAKDPCDRYEWAGDVAADMEMAFKSPDTFIAPPVRPSMYPHSPSTLSMPGPPQYVQTPPPGPPSFVQTPSGGIPPYAGTPPGGMPLYGPVAGPLTPPAGVLPARRRRWILPVVGLGAFAMLSVLTVAAILLWPQLMVLLRGRETPTAVAVLPTATSAPRIHWFRIVPTEIRQGDSVTIEWNVSGVTAVTILPDVGEDLPAQGELRHVPGESTVYKLVLPDGTAREVEVKVSSAPNAPVIAFFTITPQPAVRGQNVVLSWQIGGDTTRVELSRGFDTIQGLNPTDELTLAIDEPTLFILRAYNGDLLTSQSIKLEVVDPTATPTPIPTEAPTQTPTLVPPTATLTEAPPTATATREGTPVAPKPTATRGPQPTTAPGVLHSFEQWGTWTRGDQPYGELVQSQEQKKSGAYAAKLTYNFGAASDENDFVVFRNVTALGGEPNTISAWVYGDESGHFLNLWIEDAERQVWSVHLGKINFSGWRQLSGTIDPNRPWPSGKVFGTDNGRIDYPIRFYSIVLDRPGSGPRTGTIFIDDITTARAEVTVDQPAATATVTSPGAGEIGRIVFTMQVDKSYYLYSTDPNWDKAVKIGDTDWGHGTCLESNMTASTLDGTVVNLRPIERCPIAGTVGSCPSPNGLYKVNTSNQGSYFSVVLWNVTENKMQEAYFEGALNIYPGLNWAPDSSHFLFTVDQSVYRADVGKPGYRQVIPFKEKEYPLQYTPDGSYVYYLKPVSGAISDIFLARPDGSGERNLTNAPISIKLCPRWRQ